MFLRRVNQPFRPKHHVMITSVSFFQSDLTLLSITESPSLNSRLHRKLKWLKCPFLLVESLFLGKEQMRGVGFEPTEAFARGS